METLDDILEHHGIKGMKWGVRKNYDSIRNRSAETLNLTTSKGTTVTIAETKIPPIGAAIGALSSRARKNLLSGRSFQISVDGKKVGQASLAEKSKEEVNLVWLGVNPKQRGKGYASTVFDAGVAYAKSKGYSKITLEVPGNAPDARHIYEKRGFKQSGPVMGNARDIWGGLTPMTLDISKSTNVQHDAISDEADMEKAIEQTFGVMGIDNIMFANDLNHAAIGESVLEHHGIKGMKWGVRRSDPSGGTAGTPKAPSSEDATRAAAAQNKARTSGTHTLSNKELQDLVTRMNLEQQYSRLNTSSKQSSAGRKFIKDLLVNTAQQQVKNLANDAARKQVAKLMVKAATG